MGIWLLLAQDDFLWLWLVLGAQAGWSGRQVEAGMSGLGEGGHPLPAQQGPDQEREGPSQLGHLGLQGQHLQLAVPR